MEMEKEADEYPVTERICANEFHQCAHCWNQSCIVLSRVNIEFHTLLWNIILPVGISFYTLLPSVSAIYGMAQP